MAELDETYAPVEGCCNACRHYDPTAFGKANYGHCRRYPPVAVEKLRDGLPRGVWPVVGYDDSCGEYRPARRDGARPGGGPRPPHEG